MQSALRMCAGKSDKARMGLEAWVKATDRDWWEMNPATGNRTHRSWPHSNHRTLKSVPCLTICKSAWGDERCSESSSVPRSGKRTMKHLDSRQNL